MTLAALPIRDATPADAAAIADLHTASWRATYATMLDPGYLEHTVPTERLSVWEQRLASPKPNQHVVLLEQHDKVIGFACAFAGEHAQWGSYLENLHVHASMQRQGLGAKLVREVARRCEQEIPGQGLYLMVNQANTNAQHFYYRLGARNAEASVWNAPDGNEVPTFRFVWDSTALLTSFLQP